MDTSSQQADDKGRFGGILENPYVALAVRDLLDYGRWQGLARTIGTLNVKSVLDIGCGWGENSRVCPSGYTGIDNSASRIEFARRRYPQGRFILADALEYPLQEKSFDLAMLIDTSHHLTEGQLLQILDKMKRCSRRWIVVSDPVLYDGQGAASRFFYRLDRGAMFRPASHMEEIFQKKAGLVLERTDFFTTLPGFYRHGVFLLRAS